MVSGTEALLHFHEPGVLVRQRPGPSASWSVSGGSRLGCLAGYGSGSSPVARSWVGWIGNGNRPTGRWARPVWGGCHWEEPHRPGKAGNQAQHPGRGRRRAVEHRGGRGQRPRHQAAPGIHPSHADGRAAVLCLDKGYDNPTGREAARQHGYEAHIRRIGEEKLDAAGHPARGGWWNGPGPSASWSVSVLVRQRPGPSASWSVSVLVRQRPGPSASWSVRLILFWLFRSPSSSIARRTWSRRFLLPANFSGRCTGARPGSPSF